LTPELILLPQLFAKRKSPADAPTTATFIDPVCVVELTMFTLCPGPHVFTFSVPKSRGVVLNCSSDVLTPAPLRKMAIEDGSALVEKYSKPVCIPRYLGEKVTVMTQLEPTGRSWPQSVVAKNPNPEPKGP